MAEKDGRTEKATGKRRSQARQKGQVARSQDISSAVGLIAAFAALAIGAPSTLHKLEDVVTRGLAQSADPTLATRDGAGVLAMWGMRAFVGAVAPVLIAAVIAGFVANVAQVRLKFTLGPLKPTFSKLSPLSGFKRLLGPSGIFEAGKAIVKLVIIGGVAFLAIWPKLPTMGALVGLPPDQLLSTLGGEVVGIVLRVLGMLVVLSAIDYIWQHRRLEKALMMKKEEVKQEQRQTDVAPEVRSAIRKKQFQQARRRMILDVALADVVVVNPTHYAAALRYDGLQPAPDLVAKGVDHIAAAIRAAAEEHGVPIVSNPPLARTLYRDVELGEQIPEELFAAVAEVLAYVYRVAGRRRTPRPERGRRALPRGA